MKYTSRKNIPQKNNKYYINYDFGGYNVAIPINKTSGWVMPNCVGYAQGRYREICGDMKIWSNVGVFLSGNAETFWPNAVANGFKTGQIPRLGSIVVYEGAGEAAGHVSIVEEIVLNKDKDDIDYIITSNSAYKGEEFFTQKLTKEDGYLYNKDGSRPLLGFIYQDKEFENDPTNGLFTEGFLDVVELKDNKINISGWAWNGIDDSPLSVYITIKNSNGEQMALISGLADFFRPDLKEAGKGDGNHGFLLTYDVSEYEPGEYIVTAKTMYDKSLVGEKNFVIPKPIQNEAPKTDVTVPAVKVEINENSYGNYKEGTNQYYRVKVGNKQLGAYIIFANAFRKYKANKDAHIYDANGKQLI